MAASGVRSQIGAVGPSPPSFTSLLLGAFALHRLQLRDFGLWTEDTFTSLQPALPLTLRRSRVRIWAMAKPYTMAGKIGKMVYQLNRYGQICYPAFIPANPRTPAQQAIRGIFGAVSKRWRTLTEEQRRVWIAVAATILSKPRLSQCGPLTGLQLFVKVNVYLAYRGQP